MQHLRRALALAPLALAGFTSVPAFANVLKVAPTGAPYTQIQAAVNAAANGDTILISPGSYGAVSISGKSVTLCTTTLGTVFVSGTTSVTNLTATQRVLLSGLRGTGQLSQALGDAGVGLLIANNAGSVRVESCTFIGANGWGEGTGPFFPSSCCSLLPAGVGRHAAVIRDNTQGVSLIASEFQGGRGATPNTNPFACYCGSSGAGGDGVQVRATLVSLYDSKCYGGNGGNNATDGGAGGAGCRAVSGTGLSGVFASGSLFQGSRGGDAWDYLGPVQGGSGGYGIFVAPSTHAHLLDNVYVGGAGGLSYFGTFPPGAPGLGFGGGGTIFHDPESRLVMTAERVVRAGSHVDVVVQGTPGQQIRLIASPTPTFQILASWRGTLLSLPGKGAADVYVGQIPANGVLRTRYDVPHHASAGAASTVFLQAYRTNAVLGPKLAAGTSIVLLR